jgi:hypothetical protein
MAINPAFHARKNKTITKGGIIKTSFAFTVFCGVTIRKRKNTANTIPSK